MGRVQTWEKQTDENGNEVMVLVEDYFVPDPPEPTKEELEIRAEELMTELQSILDKLKNG